MISPASSSPARRLARRGFSSLLHAGFTTLLPIAAAGSACGRGPGEVQAVVLVTLDTTRADRIGCYGNHSIETPALDEVARQGVLFEQASAVAPLTLPSHASMMTGRTPASHGVRHNGMFSVPLSERTLAEVFKAHGFDTAAFVASFPVSSAFGLQQGFDVYDERFDPPRDDKGFLYEERNAASVNAAILPWLASEKGRKFFLWVHYFDPHAPYEPPSPFKERYSENPYDGEIAFADSKLAELLAHLTKVVDLRRTVLAIAGDHGESLRQHGETSHGLFVYEATIRVPLLLRAAGRVPEGTRVAQPVTLVDLFPTLLRLAGIAEETKKGPKIEGIDLVDLSGSDRRSMEGASGEAHASGAGREILLESLLGLLEHGWSELHAIRSGSLKYVEAPRPELYDLSADPMEMRNLLDDPAPGSKESAAELKRRLDAALAAAKSRATGGEARRDMDPETSEKLRSLGYLQGGAAAVASKIPAGEIGRGEGATSADPKDMVGLFEGLNDAGLMVRQGDIEGALAAYRSLLARAPGDPAIQRRIGEALLTMKRFDELESFLQPLAGNGGVGSARSPFWVDELLAKAREIAGDNEAAIALYRSAMTKDPDYAVNGIRVAVLLRRMGRLEESRAEAGRILGKRPSYLPAYEVAADDERDLGRQAAAVQLWRKAASIAPDNPAVLAPLGRLLLEAGQVAEARGVCERLAKAAPAEADGQLLLGAVAVVEGHPTDAIPFLRKARSLSPDSADALYWLGTALTETRQLAAAEEPLAEMVRRFPDVSLGWRALGRLRTEQGRSDEAVSLFRRCLALKPGDEYCRRSLDRLESRP